MLLDEVEILSSLVALPSVNPMGKPVTGPEFLEGRVTDFLEQLFRRLNVPWQRQPVESGRDNILARLDGEGASAGQLLLLEAHQDTVPVTGMTIEPWTPLVRDGRLHGRGACDVKGGLTSMLCAFARLANERPANRPSVVLASTVNEEHGFSGATALAKSWLEGSALLPRVPDAVIVAEPTQLQVVVAHKGVVRWRCHTHGRAAHSSQPQLGENAIYGMAKVLAALERYQLEIAPRMSPHPLCGGPSLSVGTIAGGMSVNTVPDRATIEIDRRLAPAEVPLEAYRELIEFVAVKLPSHVKVTHEPPYMTGGGLSDANNAGLAESLANVVRTDFVECRKLGVPYGTNAAAFSPAGAPSVVFGPGSIEQAHTADEWVELEQVVRASRVLFEFARRPLVTR